MPVLDTVTLRSRTRKRQIGRSVLEHQPFAGRAVRVVADRGEVAAEDVEAAHPERLDVSEGRWALPADELEARVAGGGECVLPVAVDRERPARRAERVSAQVQADLAASEGVVQQRVEVPHGSAVRGEAVSTRRSDGVCGNACREEGEGRHEEQPPQSRTASASISTNQRGSISSVTIPVQAGRAWAKTSPWARMTSSMWSRSVTKMRVRTTSVAVAPPSSRAARRISRHRRAWPYASAGGSA